MKMKLLLFLCCVLRVSADAQHSHFRAHGCSDSEGEDIFTQGGDCLWYADFDKGEGVVTLPYFIDSISFDGVYDQAVYHLHLCRLNMNVIRKALKDIPLEQDPPSTFIIYPRDDVDLDQKNTLLCHVSGFYPAPVSVSWTKNGRNVSEGTAVNRPFPNEDGTFRQTARLDFVPKDGDFYSCSVHHPALKTPMTRIWDIDLSTWQTQPGVGPSVFCGLGLLVGLVGVAVGTFFLIKGNKCR
ncbi:H-2 class II histocompatibility antigen, A-U alpha chain-like [Salarias fasciatus]|uniref:H-2 class II histocompatibility antigen, A-U alpha chain-like n=1 Tax=Salarias fasciatus TaxID=181472 RepID=A0A672F5Q8_SALFA|nr:H-2 class II histocompatibility antigen, A-U alpha chain-like [Salarias fasciatus]